RALAARLDARGAPVALVAETGGQNAMIVDSSALAEQVVGDAIASAFDSAGQRCSALRVLCLQDDVADHVLAMLEGAMRELSVGNPDRLSVDVGPVIDEQARATIEAHVEHMRLRGRRVVRLDLPPDCARGTFVAPTLIEIDSIAELEREVFGPVLHVLRYRRDRLDSLVDAINATGYGLTFGLHTRIDETIARVTARVRAGNVYVNRNTIGAVVGVQPFGGCGLSGTGPKAGGPLMLDRLRTPGRGELRAALGEAHDLPGPVGERNQYRLVARGRVAALASTVAGLSAQVGAALDVGNSVVVSGSDGAARLVAGLPPELAQKVELVADWSAIGEISAVLFDGEGEALRAINARVAALAGPVVPVIVPERGAGPGGRARYPPERLVDERAIATNTAAAGGNASLMTIG
ncbi:MAG: aldehyde dehydrogenase family protein, partial [Burkholderiaceae bacterium]|nr:aldehyde dehydrogenase family protein [Burkholderiaceae bacterium]